MLNKAITTALLGLGLTILPSGLAHAATPVMVKLTGHGTWSVECTWTDEKGREKVRSTHGRRSMETKTLVLRDYMSGVCAVSVNESADITLRLDMLGEDFCPLDMVSKSCAVKVTGPTDTKLVLLERPSENRQPKSVGS